MYRNIHRHIPLFALLISGCGTITTPPVPMHTAAEHVPYTAPAVPVATGGAIFNAASHRPLFEDRRARLVGDTITITIEETLQATQQSTTKLDRSGSLSAGITAFPFAKASTLAKLNAGANSATSQSGDGTTDSNNTFNGTITVLVQQVLPNGNLVVSGEKHIGVNQNVDILRFSGIVNPNDIRAGNNVSSLQVAEARVEQRGRGDVGRIQGMGWLSRFFLSVAPV